jgi:hypothetical protein
MFTHSIKNPGIDALIVHHGLGDAKLKDAVKIINKLGK